MAVKIHLIALATSALSGVAVVSTPAITVVEVIQDRVQIIREIHAMGDMVLPQNHWVATFDGPILSQPNSSVDLSTGVDISFFIAEFEPEYPDQPHFIDSVRYSTLARFGYGDSFGTTDSYYADATTLHGGGQPKVNGDVHGYALVTLQWVFRVKGDTGVGYIDFDVSDEGHAGFSVMNLTTSTLIAESESSSRPWVDWNFQFWELSVGHNYQVNAYAWTEDFGGGDPYASFHVNFGDALVVSAPEGGRSLLTLGFALAVLLGLRHLQRGPAALKARNSEAIHSPPSEKGALSR